MSNGAHQDMNVPLADRLAARRPDPGTRHVMHQHWDDLLFLHWRLPPAVVQATLPPGLRVDCFGGEAWVGVVPFRMNAVRPRFVPPMPGLSWFLELNVRTYVVDRHGRPGVWFYSLDCNQPLACAVARRFFHLPYRDAQMTASRRVAGGSYYASTCEETAAVADFEFERPRGISPAEATPGTLEFFLIERYRLFAFDALTRRLFSGQVTHAPYRLARPVVGVGRLAGLFQSVGLPEPVTPACSQLWSPGVRVRIFGVTLVSEMPP
jgi:uncharacterized protein YqjF (DUF2071 family)